MLKNNNVKSSEVSIKAIIGQGTEILYGTSVDAKTKLGSFCYVGKNCAITKTEIGNYCSIANNVSIGQGEHDLSLISTSSFFYEQPYEKLTEKPCKIGNDVWIGVDSIILRGVIVGNGAVIGANSVVTKDIPDFAVVVGSPAKIIRYRFSEEKIARIKTSEWWQAPPQEAKLIIKKLQEI
jgi:acetyltransferase-like isoleucine patch superfamily enzyme